VDHSVNFVQLKPWGLYFDGSICSKGQGAGFVVVSPSGVYIDLSIRLEFACTNNQVEYESLLHALEFLRDLGARKRMRLRYSIKACRSMCILEREREHIGSIWSRVTCLALLLVVAQSLERRAPGDSQSLQRLTVTIGNKQHKQINKQYTKQCIMTNQTIPKDATRRYGRVSARIT
jgi:hypothetical protein